jgi:hypothetical protein
MPKSLTRALLLAAVAGTALGPALAAPAAAAPLKTECTSFQTRRGEPTARLRLQGVRDDGVARIGPRFSGEWLRDLVIQVIWRQVDAGTTQRVELHSPDGALYQRFVAEVDRKGIVETRVPVAGSWITLNGLFGEWTAVLYLDGEPGPLVTCGFLIDRPGR